MASLWPLRDDLAAEFFGRFYDRLAEGESVAAALRSAQQELARAGLPARAWAGVVVLGDGSLAPVAPRAAAARWWPTLLILAGVLVAGITLWRAGRLRPGSR